MLLLKTEHFRHTFIFWLQLSCFIPWQMVPLMNQQRWPTRNSHAGQACRFWVGHSRISQQGQRVPPISFFMASRNNICRSIWTGTFRHPCSKAWTARTDTPNNWARAFWVFSSFWRADENSLISIGLLERSLSNLPLTSYITLWYIWKNIFTTALPSQPNENSFVRIFPSLQRFFMEPLWGNSSFSPGNSKSLPLGKRLPLAIIFEHILFRRVGKAKYLDTWSDEQSSAWGENSREAHSQGPPIQKAMKC